MSCVERHNKFKQRNNEVWLSLVERCVRDAEVAGSNPVIPTNKKGRLFGVLFCWSAGERILFCRLNTPCPDQTRKTTLTVFFHTFFPSVGDKPAQKSLGVFFIWCQGSKKPAQRVGLCPNETRRGRCCGSPSTHPSPCHHTTT